MLIKHIPAIGGKNFLQASSPASHVVSVKVILNKMEPRIITTLFLIIGLTNLVLGSETAFLKFDYLDEKYHGKERFEELSFSINGKIYSPDNEIHEIEINTKDFDEIIFGENGKFMDFIFLTKFKKGNTYIIQYNICTNTYVLFAENDRGRGDVKFVNKSKQPIIGEIGYLIQDTIKERSESEFHFAVESANCYFKVCPIKIYKSGSNVEFNYSDEELNNITLAEVYYHFLHKEKIVVEFSISGEINLKIEK